MKRSMLMSVVSSVLCLGAGLHAQAATAPYFNDFTASNLGNEATTTVNSSWTLNTGAGTYTATHGITATGGAQATITTASLAITNLATEPLFAVESLFTYSTFDLAISEGDSAFGFGIFGANNNFSGTGNGYYLVDMTLLSGSTPNALGRVRILEVQGNGGTTAVAGNFGTLDEGTTYLLRLVGTRTGSTLNMTFGVYDATGTTLQGTAATMEDTSPLAGTFFGYRNRTTLSAGSIQVAFQDFSVTIPEPASMTLLGLGGLLLAGRRRNA